MKIIGLLRIRNESHIIRDTLDHMATFCDFVCVYDDCSTDRTAEYCLKHPIVKELVSGDVWSKDRLSEEFRNRQRVLELGKKYATSNDWFIYMDADERIEFDFQQLKNISYEVIGIKMKLFDFYITPEDAHLDYSFRTFMGCEYRTILMAFRNLPTLKYHHKDQREVSLGQHGTILQQGFVKHYGKAISVEEWEHTCDYYSTYFPAYREKWKLRKGKAIHTTSDFGTDLITWEQKEVKGIPMT